MKDEFEVFCLEVRIQGLTYSQEKKNHKTWLNVLNQRIHFFFLPYFKKTNTIHCTNHRVLCTLEQCGRFLVYLLFLLIQMQHPEYQSTGQQLA